jgi:hypothetical protein
MALRFRDVFWPFIGGQDESIEPKIHEQGFQLVENGQFDKLGRISKRPGITRLATNDTGSGRLAVYRGTPLVTDNGSQLRAWRVSGGVLATNDISTDLIPEATVQRRARVRDMSVQTTLGTADVAVSGFAVGMFTVMIWKEPGPPNGRGVACRIVETTTGTVVRDQVLNSAAHSPRLTTNGDYVLATYLVGAEGAIELRARRIDCTVSPPLIGIETTLATLDSSFYDVCARDTGWCVVDREAAQLTINYITSANPPTVLASATVAVDVSHKACKEVDGRIFIAYYDVTNTDVRYEVRSNLGPGIVVLGPTSLEFAPVSPGPIGIAPAVIAGSQAVISWISNAELLKWVGDASDAGLIAGGLIHQNWRCAPESKPFFAVRDVGGGEGVYQWVRTTSGGNTAQDVYVLVHLSASFVDAIEARPVCTAAFGITPVGQTALLRNVDRQSALEPWTYHSAMQVQISPQTVLYGLDEIQVDFADKRRHSSVRFGECLYFSGGVVSQWDGVQLVENSYIQSPRTGAPVQTGVGTMADGTYQMCLVYEEYDDAGEVSRSIPSEIRTINVAAGGGTAAIAIDLYPLTLTMRQDFARQTPKVQLALYMSVVNPPATAPVVFYRHLAVDSTSNIDNDWNRTTVYAYAITAPVSTSNPRLYTDGNVLPNDPVWGGATLLALHKERLWASGGEDPEVLYYSQPRVAGEPALFSLFQSIRIPGETITALASLDDALIVFTETKIFGIFGDGPDATGNTTTGQFSDPIPIASDTGCIESRSVATIPSGVVFQGQRGLMQLDRGRQLTFIGEPLQDSTYRWDSTTYSVVQACTVVPGESQVRWLVAESTNTSSRVFVWDYSVNKWAVWHYFAGAHFRDAAMAGSVAQVWAALRTSDSDLYFESPTSRSDNAGAGAVWYGVAVLTGDIGFGNPLELKRLRRVGVLFDRVGTGGMIVSVFRSGGGVTGPPQYIWTEAEVAALDTANPSAVRCHVRNQKGYHWRIRVEETSAAAPDGGLAFIGLQFEVASIGKTTRLGAANTRA